MRSCARGYYGRHVSEEQIKALNEVGFCWQLNVLVTFEERVEQLKTFKEKHGHVRVTTLLDPSLRGFCSNMRACQRGYITALDEVGFIGARHIIPSLLRSTFE